MKEEVSASPMSVCAESGFARKSNSTEHRLKIILYCGCAELVSTRPLSTNKGEVILKFLKKRRVCQLFNIGGSSFCKINNVPTQLYQSYMTRCSLEVDPNFWKSDFVY